MGGEERMSGKSAFAERIWIAVLSIAAVWIAGCGGSERPKTIPFTGRVTINGQAPGESGRVHFQAVQPAEGYTKRPASGAFPPDGNIRVMSWEPDDGLVPGRYTVSLMPGDLNTTKIPPKYQQGNTSGLELDVPLGESKVNFDINVVTN
jgi:hypothetical protein